MSYYTNGLLCLEFDFKWHGSHILMKMRKTCFAIRNKDLTFSNSTTCYIPIIHPGLWQFTKVHNYGLLSSKGILWTGLLVPLSFFQVTILIWETLFWIMSLWECSNASFFVCMFSKNSKWMEWIIFTCTMKRPWLLAAIYPPGDRDTFYHEGVFNFLTLKSETVSFVVVVMIYMMVHKAQVTRKSYVQWSCPHKQVHLQTHVHCIIHASI